MRRRDTSRRSGAASVLAASLLTACTAATGANGSDTGLSPSPDAARSATSGVDATGPGSSALPPVSRLSAPFFPTSTTAPPALRPVPASPCRVGTADPLARGPQLVRVADPVPPGSEAPTTTIPTPATAIADLLADERVKGATVSVSVWIDGMGEAIMHEPDTRLRPASNQKLITAMGALAHLDPDERLSTDVLVTGPIVDGVVQGNLALVGGGDPSVTATGPHSIDALAKAVADHGIVQIDGSILVDESRYDAQRHAPGVPEKWWEDIGSLSALAVDRNWSKLDKEYLADPAVFDGDVLRTALAFRGVGVRGSTLHGNVTEGVKIAGLESATVNELVNLMLLRSDNFYAEMLLKELSFRGGDRPGTTAGGIAVIRRLLAGSCVALQGTIADGSGLSYDNFVSARELRSLMQWSQTQPWGSLLFSDLPLAGVSEGFGGRLDGPATSGRVRAKGGVLNVSRSLTGFTATQSGRPVVFSVIVNAPSPKKAELAIDDFVTALASLPI